MDIHFFLQERLDFIEQYYDWSAEAFEFPMRKMERGEEPYTEVDPEGGESPYQDVWNRCHESLDVLGQHCVTMLATSIRLYLDEYLRRMGSTYRIDAQYTRRDKNGWLNGYRKLFLGKLAIDWSKSPASLDVLEQIVLARNDFEHPMDLGFMRVRQNDEHFKKYKDSFFADAVELSLFKAGRTEDDEFLFFPWHMNVSRGQLFAAIEEVRKFCTWLEIVWNYYRGFLKGEEIPTTLPA